MNQSRSSRQVPFVDLSCQYASIQKEIDDAISHVIHDGWFVGGKEVAAFERNYAQYTGVKYCLGCANGSDALEIALEGIGVGPNDEVIVPAMSWIATSGAVGRVGAHVVFVDILPGKFTIDPQDIVRKITHRTKAIIVVHLYGRPAEMDEILEIARENNLLVIEDAAQAHGALYKGKPVGSLGHVGIFSFYPSKNLGSFGDAGCIVSNDGDLITKCRWIANNGQPERNVHLIEGRNSRMDAIQAAVLNVKLRHLPLWIAQRSQKARYYIDALGELPIELPSMDKHSEHAFHLFIVLLDNRDHVQQYLTECGVQTQIHYPSALPMLKPYGLSSDEYPVAKMLAERCISLPFYPEIPENDMDHVIDQLKHIV